jgi:hypothetical protein
MQNLSREDLRNIIGGKQAPGTCTESCGVEGVVVTCTSEAGMCSRSGNLDITCDDTVYGCPQ